MCVKCLVWAWDAAGTLHGHHYYDLGTTSLVPFGCADIPGSKNNDGNVPGSIKPWLTL